MAIAKSTRSSPRLVRARTQSQADRHRSGVKKIRARLPSEPSASQLRGVLAHYVHVRAIFGAISEIDESRSQARKGINQRSRLQSRTPPRR